MKRVILFLALLSANVCAFAQATFVSATRIDFNGVATNTASVTIPASNCLFIGYIGRQGTETGFSTVTYDGSTLTPQESSTLYSGGGIASFGAAYNGVSGTALTLSVTLDAAPVFGHVYAVVYSNCDTADEITDSDAAEGATSPISITNTSATTSLHVSLAYWRTGVATAAPAIQAGNSQTQFEAPVDNANGNLVYGSYRPGAASTANTGYTFTDGTFPQWAAQTWTLGGVSVGGSSPVSKIIQQH